MRRPSFHRGVAALAAATALVGLLSAPARAADDPQAGTEVPVTTQPEKARAIQAIGREVTNDWVALDDQRFVFRVYDTLRLDTAYAQTSEEAYRVYKATLAEASTFIRTGIHDFVERDHQDSIRRGEEARKARAARESAARRDNANAQKAIEEAERAQVRDVRSKAEASRLRPRVVAAANAALAGTREDVQKFLREGQYQVLEQSLMASQAGKRGSYIYSTGADPMVFSGNFNYPTPMIPATWKISAALPGAPGCYSFESSRAIGNYLRQQDLAVKMHANDGTEQFKVDATWCPKAAGENVALESKSKPGRYLRNLDGKLWAAAASGPNAFDGGATFSQDIAWETRDPNPPATSLVMRRWFNDAAVASAVGRPTGKDVINGHDGNRITYREFENGVMTYHLLGSNAVHWMNGPVASRYRSLGGIGWRMPAADQETLPGGGQRVRFNQGEHLYWGDKSREPKLVYGLIQQRWEAEGGYAGWLGYPISDEYGWPDGRRSDFQVGWIDYYYSTGQTAVFRW